jgi:hypothetical protein
MALDKIGNGYYFSKFIKIKSVGSLILILVTVALSRARSPFYESSYYSRYEFDAGSVYCILVL